MINKKGIELEYTIALCKEMLKIKAWPETNNYWRNLLQDCKDEKERVHEEKRG